MLHWTLQEYHLPLRYTWKIHKGAADQKRIFLLKVQENGHAGYGEVAGVTRAVDEGQMDLPSWLKQAAQTLSQNPEHLIQDLSLAPPIRMAVDEAMHDLRAQQQGLALHRILKIPEQKEVATTYALPVLPIDQVGRFIQQYDLTRFSSLKIKIDHHSTPELCQEVRRHYPGPLWLDANQAFVDVKQALRFLKGIDTLPIKFIEQPFAAADLSSHRQLRGKSPFPVFADESLQDGDITPSLLESFDGFNVKLLKAGSYWQALQQIEQAQSAKRPILLGCMVETSVGISAAFPLAAITDYHDLDGFLYFAQEPQQRLVEIDGKIRPRVAQKNGNPL